MNDYIIMTDSCIDLTDEMAKNLDLHVLPLTVNIDGKEYKNYLDEREITIKDFYQHLRDHTKTSTSQINANVFTEAMTPLLEEGKDILYIGFSSALSGTYNSSLIAKEDLSSDYPNRKIITLDSLCASMGQGLLLTYAARLKKEGKSIVEVAKWVEDNKLNISHLFTVGDLNHLKRGGRLSSSKALIGTILRVKPLLNVSSEGKLVQTGKTRGRKQSLDAMVERLVATIVNPTNQLVYISHGDCLDEAVYVKNEILKQVKVKDVIVNFIGPVVGSHSGLGTLAIFYMGKDRFEPYE